MIRKMKTEMNRNKVEEVVSGGEGHEFVMISQPMFKKTEEEVYKSFKDARERLLGEGYKTHEVPLSMDKGFRGLMEHLEMMSKSGAVYFCVGSKADRFCNIEHYIAKKFGLRLLYEDKDMEEEK